MKLVKKITSIFLAAAMCLQLSSAFAGADSNQTDVPRWTFAEKNAQGIMELTSDVKKSGNNSLHIVKTNAQDGSDSFLRVHNTVSIEKDTEYVYGCSIKTEKALNIRMFILNDMRSLTPFAKTNDWTDYEFKVTATAANVAQWIGFICYDKAADIWIDDVYMYKLENGQRVGTNMISNPGFEDSSPSSGTTNSREWFRPKNVDRASDFLSVSSELPVYRKNITVDGDFSDWEGVAKVDFLRYYRAANYTGELNNTANARFAYDDNNFYCLVESHDAIHSQTAGEYWACDCLQFMLSDSRAVYGEEYAINHLENGESYASHDIDFKTLRKDGVTYYEFAIPWGNNLPDTPSDFYFNAALNNNDGDGRIYMLEMREGIVTGKSAQKAVLMHPVEDDCREIVYIEGTDLTDVGKAADYTLYVVNLGDAADITVTLPDGEKNVRLNADSVYKEVFSTTFDKMGTATVSATVFINGKSIDAAFSTTVQPDEALLNDYVEKFTEQIAELRATALELNAKNIPTDYEDMYLNAFERSVEMLGILFAQGDVDVVSYDILVIESRLDEIEATLAAYASGEKTPFTVPQYDGGKMVLRGNDFYADTDDNGKKENRPIFVIGSVKGWENRDEYPNWRGFGYNTTCYTIVFKDAVGQANAPALWESQRGTVGWSDCDALVTEDEAKSGKRSVKYVNRTALKTGYAFYLYQTISDLKSNTKYVYGCSVKGNLNGMKVSFGSSNELTGTADEWQNYEFSYTTNDNPSNINFTLLSQDVNEGAYIDDVYLREEGSDVNLLKNPGFESYYEQWEDSEFGVNYDAIDDACGALRRAEFYKLGVTLSTDMTQASSYINRIEGVKDTTKNYSTFIRNNVTHEKFIEAAKILYSALVPEIKDCDSLVMLQTWNEPSLNSSDSTYYKPQWHDYLKAKYGTIEKLNATYGSNYTYFDEIEMPTTKSTEVIYFDWRVFNENILTTYFREINEHIHSLAPDMIYGAKYMKDMFATTSNTLWRGINYEKLAPYETIASNDAWAYLHATTDPLESKLAWYDFQHSLTGTAVADLEDHIIMDSTTIDLDPRNYNWYVSSLWQGAIHYKALTNIWLFPRNEAPAYINFRNTTIQYRADCMYGTAKVSGDLNRLSKEVSALRNEPAQIALLFSHTSSGYTPAHMNSYIESYKNSIYSGVKLYIANETNIGVINNYPLLVIPEATHIPENVLAAVVDYMKNGGEVLAFGENTFVYNENGEQQNAELYGEFTANAQIIETGTSESAVRTAISDKMFGILNAKYKEILARDYDVVDAETGKPLEKTEWNITEYNGGIIVNYLNYDWGNTKKAKLVYHGGALSGTELISGAAVNGEVTLDPYTPTMVYYNK